VSTRRFALLPCANAVTHDAYRIAWVCFGNRQMWRNT